MAQRECRHGLLRQGPGQYSDRLRGGRYADLMSITALLIALCALAGAALLVALLRIARARRCWRQRRRLAAVSPFLTGTLTLLVALLFGASALALRGWHLLGAEAAVAELTTRELAPGHFQVRIATPDGAVREVALDGEQWQLDARVVKWKPRAILLGAPVVYRLERISGRHRDAARDRDGPRSVIALSAPTSFDLWELRRRFPRWLRWLDADFGSAAYLPLVDAGHFRVTLAAGGGLIARPADAATAEKLRAADW